jgi:hypothetical protein
VAFFNVCSSDPDIKMVKDIDIVGEALGKVLPAYDKPWFKIPHLLQLNLILLVPLLSSAVAGYDGTLHVSCDTPDF